MPLTHSTMGRLFSLAGLVLAAIGVLTAIAVGSNHRHQAALTRLYNQDIGSLVRLQRIENNLLEVRVRAAAVLLDQQPVTGSLNHLRAARQRVAANWSELSAANAPALETGEAAAPFSALQASWASVDETLGKLERAYIDKDKAAMASVLTDDWPMLNERAAQPLLALMPIAEQAAARTHASALALSQRLLVAGGVSGVACLAGVALMLWLKSPASLKPLWAMRGGLVSQGRSQHDEQVAVSSFPMGGEVADTHDTVLKTSIAEATKPAPPARTAPPAAPYRPPEAAVAAIEQARTTSRAATGGSMDDWEAF